MWRKTGEEGGGEGERREQLNSLCLSSLAI